MSEDTTTLSHEDHVLKRWVGGDLARGNEARRCYRHFTTLKIQTRVLVLPVSEARESGEIWPQKHGSQTWELEGEGL